MPRFLLTSGGSALRCQEHKILGEGRVGGFLQCLSVTGELIAMFTGKHLVLNGAQDLLGVVDDQNIHTSRLSLDFVCPFPFYFCLCPILWVAHRRHSGLKKKACEETVAKAVAAPRGQQPGQHIGMEFLRTPEPTAASKPQSADKVECIELVALFCCKFPDALQTLIRRELVEALLLFFRSSASTFARCANLGEMFWRVTVFTASESARVLATCSRAGMALANNCICSASFSACIGMFATRGSKWDSPSRGW